MHRQLPLTGYRGELRLEGREVSRGDNLKNLHGLPFGICLQSEHPSDVTKQSQMGSCALRRPEVDRLSKGEIGEKTLT